MAAEDYDAPVRATASPFQGQETDMGMNIGSLGSFAQAFQAAQAQAQQRKYQQAQQGGMPAFANMLANSQGGQGAQPSPPAMSPQIAAGLAAASGAPPPSTAGGLPSVPTGPVAPGANTVAQAFGPQGEVAQPQAPAQPQPDPNLSGTAQQMAGAPAMDSWKTGQQNLISMAQSIKRMNPGIDNLTLAYALKQGIEDMRGVDPATKIDMQMQASIIRDQVTLKKAEILAQTGDMNGARKLLGTIYAADDRVKGEEYAADKGAESREAVGAGHDAAHVSGALIGANSREDVANIEQSGAGARSGARDASEIFGRVYSSYLRAHPKATEADATKAAIAAVQQVSQARGQLPSGSNIGDSTPPPHPPAVGAVENGYKFKGGNPADKNNWVKVGAGGKGPVRVNAS